MSGCTWKHVYDRDTRCMVLRCLDYRSPNRPAPPWCNEYGAAAIVAPSDLPVAVAAPGPGFYSMPPGGWVYGLPSYFPGAPSAFGGFVGGIQYVRDAHTLEWLEDDTTAVRPLPVAYTPMPAAPVLEVPVPAPDTTPTTGTVTPPPPVAPLAVPEPAALGLFIVALAALAVFRRRA